MERREIQLAKKISILGSTGSIGTQSLDVVRGLDDVKILAMTANKNIDLFEKQVREFKPKLAVLMDEEKAYELKKRLSDMDIRVESGMDGLVNAASYDEADTVINSVVGNIGLKPTAAAVRSGKNIALANKETLVSAGELIMREIKENNVNIYPVDSEHSAVFQCIRGNEENKIKKILLTASGGPFRGYKSLEGIKPCDALKHPNWSMGKKITIDSATLMNKGLEIIEAKWLFDVEISQIEVLIHPQSVIHSMVEFEDGAVIAQLGEPDMRLPIQYALTYPKRLKNNFPKIDFLIRNNLTFEKPETDLFACLNLAYDAIKTGGTMPAVMNAANERAVYAFIDEKIEFNDIPKLIKQAMREYNVKYNYDLDDVLAADKWGRLYIDDILSHR